MPDMYTYDIYIIICTINFETEKKENRLLTYYSLSYKSKLLLNVYKKLMFF